MRERGREAGRESKREGGEEIRGESKERQGRKGGSTGGRVDRLQEYKRKAVYDRSKAKERVGRREIEVG